VPAQCQAYVQGGACAIQTQDTAPSGSQPTTYFFAVPLTPNTPARFVDIINNGRRLACFAQQGVSCLYPTKLLVATDYVNFTNYYFGFDINFDNAGIGFCPDNL
jgi:hypothetical protein